MEEFSAGGVVVRDADVVVIVPVKRDASGRRVLGLPKGHPEPGESAAEAAMREVREETGLEVELREPLGEIQYHYERRRGGRVAKRVAFFLFAHRGGSLEDHDHEIEEARWMPLAEAERALSYVGEREMVQRARSILAADR
jgi:8-oxo-dGTP pyrophosphatase MutT (NUDIX family)